MILLLPKLYLHIEKKLDEDVTTEIHANGTIGTIYIGVEFKNMKKEVTERSISDILKIINIEQLKMENSKSEGS